MNIKSNILTVPQKLLLNHFLTKDIHKELHHSEVFLRWHCRNKRPVSINDVSSQDAKKFSQASCLLDSEVLNLSMFHTRIYQQCMTNINTNFNKIKCKKGIFKKRYKENLNLFKIQQKEKGDFCDILILFLFCFSYLINK